MLSLILFISSLAFAMGATIAELAAATGDLSTLAQLLTDNGLLPVFSNATSAPLTVFAPTNAAFTAATDALASLTAEQTTDILKYHVINGAVTSGQVVDHTAAPTLDMDKKIFFTVANGMVKVNDGATGGATVSMADVSADNGVIHIIDKVLMPPANIKDTAIATSTLSTLVSLLVETNLADVFISGEYTVFAPTDDAFAAIADALDTLTVEQKADILKYHVIPNADIRAQDIMNAQKVASLQGAELTFTLDNGMVMVDNATVSLANVLCSNGLVHVIDSVLMPPAAPATDAPTIAGAATATADLSTLVTLLDEAGLVPTFSDAMGGPFTVFAPTNAAFEAVMSTLDTLSQEEKTALLKYHVIEGAVMAADVTDHTSAPTLDEMKKIFFTVADGMVKVNDGAASGATVSMADVVASNGVVHIVDAVLMPPMTIKDTAIATPSLSTLVSLLVEANLADVFGVVEDTFTVLAPSDDAFAAINETLATLTPEQVADVLKYHVIADADIRAQDLVNGQEATTLLGQKLMVTVDGADVMFNDAKVTLANVLCSNGQVHVIDKVLIPNLDADSSSSGTGADASGSGTGADASGTGADASGTGADGTGASEEDSASSMSLAIAALVLSVFALF